MGAGVAVVVVVVAVVADVVTFGVVEHGTHEIELEHGMHEI